MRILIVEDEKRLARSIFDFLRKEEGLMCEMAHSYRDAFAMIRNNCYDCILLDITLPDGNGLDLLTVLKQEKSNTGILIISARNTTNNKVEGLDQGADDYMTKPFHLSELNARVKSILRRRNFNGDTELVFGQIRILPHQRAVFVNDTSLSLTPKEYSLLLYFISNKNRVVTKESLADHFWENNFELSPSNEIIYTHIKNLRHKIIGLGGKDYIRTVYGIGYKLSYDP
ncbi:MAG: response regulator transcription factor [Breznakibacter sp.]